MSNIHSWHAPKSPSLKSLLGIKEVGYKGGSASRVRVHLSNIWSKVVANYSKHPTQQCWYMYICIFFWERHVLKFFSAAENFLRRESLMDAYIIARMFWFQMWPKNFCFSATSATRSLPGNRYTNGHFASDPIIAVVWPNAVTNVTAGVRKTAVYLFMDVCLCMCLCSLCTSQLSHKTLLEFYRKNSCLKISRNFALLLWLLLDPKLSFEPNVVEKVFLHIIIRANVCVEKFVSSFE